MEFVSLFLLKEYPQRNHIVRKKLCSINNLKRQNKNWFLNRCDWEWTDFLLSNPIHFKLAYFMWLTILAYFFSFFFSLSVYASVFVEMNTLNVFVGARVQSKTHILSFHNYDEPNEMKTANKKIIWNNVTRWCSQISTHMVENCYRICLVFGWNITTWKGWKLQVINVPMYVRVWVLLRLPHMRTTEIIDAFVKYIYMFTHLLRWFGNGSWSFSETFPTLYNFTIIWFIRWSM